MSEPVKSLDQNKIYWPKSDGFLPEKRQAAMLYNKRCLEHMLNCIAENRLLDKKPCGPTCCPGCGKDLDEIIVVEVID